MAGNRIVSRLHRTRETSSVSRHERQTMGWKKAWESKYNAECWQHHELEKDSNKNLVNRCLGFNEMNESKQISLRGK